MLGQAQLELRDVTKFTKKATFDLNFVEKIKVSMRCEREKFARFLPKIGLDYFFS